MTRKHENARERLADWSERADALLASIAAEDSSFAYEASEHEVSKIRRAARMNRNAR